MSLGSHHVKLVNASFILISVNAHQRNTNLMRLPIYSSSSEPLFRPVLVDWLADAPTARSTQVLDSPQEPLLSSRTMCISSSSIACDISNHEPNSLCAWPGYYKGQAEPMVRNCGDLLQMSNRAFGVFSNHHEMPTGARSFNHFLFVLRISTSLKICNLANQSQQSWSTIGVGI